jgi:hypothetical protein
MKDSELQPEQPKSLRPKAPIGPWRALFIGLFAARVLCSHGASADLGASLTVTVTSYRICVLHSCTRSEVRRLPRQNRTTRLARER